jgi:hypothetical protein
LGETGIGGETGHEGNIIWECGLNACGWGEGLVMGHCEQSYDTAGSTVSHIIVQLSKS